MSSLAMEKLLSVDDDGPKKKLKVDDGTRERHEPIEERAVHKECETHRAVHGAEVVKSYNINEACGVQILWESATGKYRYDLLEPSMTPPEAKIYDGIVGELHKKPRSELDSMKKIGGRERIRQKFERLCRERNVGDSLKEKMLYYVERDFWGYKRIDALLKDQNVEDVSCNGYGSPVYAYVPGFESIPTNIAFESEEELDDFILYLVQKGGKSISAAHPIQDVALPDGSRLNGTIYREVSSNGTTFSIRVANRTRRAAELLRRWEKKIGLVFGDDYARRLIQKTFIGKSRNKMSYDDMEGARASITSVLGDCLLLDKVNK